MTRRLVASGLVLAVLTAVTACGDRTAEVGSATLPTAAPSSSTSSSTSSAPSSAVDNAGGDVAGKRCNATMLKGAVEPTDAGAGNRYGKLVFTNTGKAPCTVSGYSGFQLQNGAGAVPTKLERMADPGPKAVSLAPGAKAAANLHWGVIPAGSEPVNGPCQPEPSKAAAIPPDETAPVNVPWTLGPVCSGGRIEISAFYAA